ncbi:type II toxin-antitoxin system VapC family toxin [Candidatus Woesearchaeota archaeon]|nr:type II toxin-antitoxin system VapC family toxin [Candidatus Woesearchaeota archaeon]
MRHYIKEHKLFCSTICVLRYIWKKKSKEAIEEVNRVLWDMNLLIEPLHESLLHAAISLSLKHNLSLYDALYLALAYRYQCPLYTADEKIAGKENVILLQKDPLPKKSQH